MNDLLIFYGLAVHYLADFCLQTNEQATKKSTSLKFLFFHVLTYSLVWFYFVGYVFNFTDALSFAGITFAAHFLTDYTTSRIGKRFWDKGDYHNGFCVVGFDQILHYLQLYYTFKLLN